MPPSGPSGEVPPQGRPNRDQVGHGERRAVEDVLRLFGVSYDLAYPLSQVRLSSLAVGVAGTKIDGDIVTFDRPQNQRADREIVGIWEGGSGLSSIACRTSPLGHHDSVGLDHRAPRVGVER